MINALFMAKGNGQALKQQPREGRNAQAPPVWEDSSFFRSLLETIPDALIVIDVSGTIVAFSHAAQAMFGYSDVEMRGRNVNIIIPPPHNDRHDDYIRTYLETGVKKAIGRKRPVEACRKGGEIFPVELAVGETTIGGRRLFLGFLHDISIRAEQQRRLRELSNELAHAERITSMGMLASAIAHELNQPLASIRNYAETVSNLAATDAPIDLALLREAMDSCAGEATRAGEIIRRLRQFIASGDTEQSAESLASLIEDALSLADGSIEMVKVSRALETSADMVLVDGIQIVQVIFNIVRNALQAMAGRSRQKLHIRSIGQDEMVEVIIEDSGSGVDHDDDNQLFLPFNTSKAGGLGIGLSICRTIVEGHGGRIWTTPSDLGGAAFHFTIPRMRSERNQQR